MSEVLRALGALLEAPVAEHDAIANALEIGPLASKVEHTEAIDFSFYPYASVYLGSEGMIGGEARDKIAGFFRAIRCDLPKEPDHLTVLLGAYATLASQPAEAAAHACKVLFWEHIASFLPAYAAALTRFDGFYARWGALCLDVLEGEAQRHGLPETPSHHLAQTRALDSLDIDALLAPVRSGIIVTRRDLVRIARALEIGVRAGERRYALRSMLAQRPSAVIEALASDASDWAKRHRAMTWNPSAAIWGDRAERCAEILLGQAKEAHHAFAV